jgi:hypothetical protein
MSSGIRMMANLTQCQMNRWSNAVVYTKTASQCLIDSRCYFLIQKPQTCSNRFILTMKLMLKHPGNGYRKLDTLLLYWFLIINGCYIE